MAARRQASAGRVSRQTTVNRQTGSNGYTSANRQMSSNRQTHVGRQTNRGPVQGDEYMYGTAAPKFKPQAVPKPERTPRKPAGSRSVRHEHRIRRNQERALYMDLPYVIMLTIASVFTLYLCINYLHVQSSITARMHNIEQMEAKLEKLKAENDAMETSINTSIDLNKIYEIATRELGMVYAKKDQVLLYDKTESEYVRQYEDIPEH